VQGNAATPIMIFDKPLMTADHATDISTPRPTPAAAQDAQQGSSWRLLILVFVVALLLFVAMRWQPEAWLRSQIDSQANKQGISLHYQDLQVNGFSVHLDKLSVHTAQMKAAVLLDGLDISPAWSSLMQAMLALRVRLIWQGQSVSATLHLDQRALDINDLDALLDVAKLQHIWKSRLPVPVDVRGMIQISGDIRLDTASGRPMHGDVHAVWQSAAAGMAGTMNPLGDYSLALTGKEQAKSVWHWLLAGGTAVVLEGKGDLNLAALKPQAWTVQGSVQLQPGKQPSPVAAMLGNKPVRLHVSGSVLKPQIQPL